MSEHEEFDKYIKGLFDESPKAPAELSWEEMDIELPQKKKRKKYGWIFFLSGVILFGLVSALYLKNNTLTKATEDKNLVSVARSEASSSNAMSPAHSNQLNNAFLESTVQTEEQLNNSSTQEKSLSTTPLRSQNNALLNSVNSSNTSNASTSRRTPTIVNSSAQENALVRSTTTVQDVLESLDGEHSNEFSNNTSSAHLSNVVNIEPSVLADKTSKAQNNLSIVQLSKLPFTPFKTWLEVSDLLTPSLADVSALEENQNEGFGIEELLFGYGLNTFNRSVDAANILSEKVSSTYGNSIHGGLKFRINDNWKVSALVQYDQYHSTFNHTRDLPPEIDIQSFRRVNRQEITFHNNFTNVLALQVGIERRWSLLKKLELSAGLNVLPTYLLSTSGKTTSGTEVNSLVFDTQTARLLMGAGLRAGIALPVDPKFNVGLYYQFNQYFGEGVFINTDVYATRQNGVGLVVSYKL